MFNKEKEKNPNLQVLEEKKTGRQLERVCNRTEDRQAVGEEAKGWGTFKLSKEAARENQLKQSREGEAANFTELARTEAFDEWVNVAHILIIVELLQYTCTYFPEINKHF